MASMAGKVVLVVGGAQGIGLAVAERLAAEQAVLYLTSRRGEAAVAAAGRIGGGAVGLAGDAGRPADLDRIVATIGAAHGHIDVLILVAGSTGAPVPLEEESGDHLDAIFAANVRTAVVGLQAALPRMRAGASVVLIGSIAGLGGAARFGAYAAAKAALRSFARSWTAELAPRGIRVNVVSPGPTATAAVAALPEAARATMAAKVPLGRLAEPREVAAAVAFLASDEASYIAGVELCVDGGARQV